MSPNKIIIATVDTYSSDDDYGMVKISAEGYYDQFGPVLVVGSIPLSKGDTVFVDISNGLANPIILDRYNKDYKGDAQLFESSDGTNWTKAVVNKNKITLTNSNNVTIEVDGANIKVTTQSGNVDVVCSKFSVNNTMLTVQ